MSFLQINKSVEYGISLMASFKEGELLSLNKISKDKHLPLKFLEQIAKKLKNQGILGSREGTKGGYFLEKSPKKISLMEIVEAIEGKKGLVSCVHGECALKKTCLQKNIWFRLQSVLEKELEKIKLKDLMS